MVGDIPATGRKWGLVRKKRGFASGKTAPRAFLLLLENIPIQPHEPCEATLLLAFILSATWDVESD